MVYVCYSASECLSMSMSMLPTMTAQRTAMELPTAWTSLRSGAWGGENQRARAVRDLALLSAVDVVAPRQDGSEAMRLHQSRVTDAQQLAALGQPRVV
ncbi:hypothetical protein PF010_g959 [Phytophthora fragariae]|nr:hypothetical protein PF010_g959 [Phytophthora fragariae]